MPDSATHSRVPAHLTADETRLMAEQVAMACAEAGFLSEVTPYPGDDRNWAFDPRIPHDVFEKARALVLPRWGITADGAGGNRP